MNRDEILEKSRKENTYGDELEKEIRIKRDSFGVWGVIVLGIAFLYLKLSNGLQASDIIALFSCYSGLAFVYEGIRLKRGWEIALGAALLLLALYSFWQFCAGLR